MAEKILLTGGTGFLGTELAARLVRLPDVTVYALVRAADRAEAHQRLRGLWYHDRNLYRAVGAQVVPVPGDFSKAGLGLSETDRRRLQDGVTLVIHAGAEIGFQKSWQELWETNCAGTENMLAFSAGIGKLRRFVHISTAYTITTTFFLNINNHSIKRFDSTRQKPYIQSIYLTKKYKKIVSTALTFHQGVVY